MITSPVLVVAAKPVPENSGNPGPRIDGLEFARQERRLAGQVRVAALERLGDVLAETAGMLDWELRGERADDGKACLLLAVSGELSLRCQRCLEVMRQPLRIESRLLLVRPGEPWPDDELLDDGYDAVAAEVEMAVWPLIEDEVLLALPIAPRHGECKSPAPLSAGRERSPFAALEKLKKGV
jgi:uncharacterized protein